MKIPRQTLFTLLFTATLQAAQAAAPYSTDSNTIGLWHLDESTSPPTQYVNSANPNAPLINQNNLPLTSVTGRFGRGVSGFSPQTVSENRLLTIGYGKISNPATHTFEAWIQFPTNSNLPHECKTLAGWTNRQFLYRRSGGRTPVEFYFTDDNAATAAPADAYLCLKLTAANGVSKLLRLPLGQTVERNRWYHVAYSIEQTGSDLQAKIYFRDETIGYNTAPPSISTTFTSFTYDSDDFVLYVGEAGQTGIDPFTGILDEIRLSNIARTTFNTLPTFNTQYQVQQSARIYWLSADNRGAGILANTGPGGLRAVHVSRTTTVPTSEVIKPRPRALIQVLDPEGKIVGLQDCTSQPTGPSDYLLPLPPNSAGGIYTVSAIGGRPGDIFTFALPASATGWGMRGELALGVPPSSAGRDYYLYLPPTYLSFSVYVYGSTSANLSFWRTSDGAALGTPAWNDATQRYELTIDRTHAAPGSTLLVTVPTGFDDTIVFDGVPGLLCADVDSASKLAGGTLETSKGGTQKIRTSGPIQKRARAWLLKQHQANPNYTVSLPLPASPPSANPILMAIPYAKSGLLNSPGSLNNQILDPVSPFFGAAGTNSKSWENFQYEGLISTFDALSMSSAYSMSLQSDGMNYNPAYHQENVLRRAVLYAFYHLSAMDGSHLFREGDLSASSTPITHTFFLYYSLAQSYFLLKSSGLLPAEADQVWRDGLLAVGDKHADFRAFQSNQWAHMIAGHLYTYLGTGETRFRDWFEEQITAYVNNVYGPTSKFGQHPGGYFLEQYGPDGNYDSINLYCLVDAYNRYEDLPDRNPQVYDAMRNAITRNLVFKSQLWLQQPDGSFVSPSAMNCRIPDIDFGVMSYPGITMAHSEFPLAARRRALETGPLAGSGNAKEIPHIINTDKWARDFLTWSLTDPNSTSDPNLKSPLCDHDAAIYYAMQKTGTVTAETLPCESPVDRFWVDNPGIFSWKKGRLYTSTFYGVPGGSAGLIGKFGGGPSCLWSAETGAVLLAKQTWYKDSEGKSVIKRVSQASEITHSAVYFTNAGVFYCSGLSNNSTFAKLADSMYQISETVTAGSTNVTVRWTYDLRNSAAPKISVTTVPLLGGMNLSLPVYCTADTLSQKVKNLGGSFSFTANGRTVRISWPGTSQASLPVSTLPGTYRLVLPITSSPLDLTLSTL